MDEAYEEYLDEIYINGWEDAKMNCCNDGLYSREERKFYDAGWFDYWESIR